LSLSEERAQGKPGADRARRSRAPEHTGIPHAEAHGQGLQVQPRQPGFPHAMALRLIRALPGERPLLPPSRSGPYHPLDARVAAPGPHDFTVRSSDFARRANPPDAAASIATRATFRDDREASLLAARAERTSASDLPDAASNNLRFPVHKFVKTEVAVIPGRAKREPGIHNHDCALPRRDEAPAVLNNSTLWLWIPGSRQEARPGMTSWERERPARSLPSW